MEKKTKKIIKHCGVWVFALITSACLVVILPKVALADPHAMFYTDKGQQQVFYNILAALNQADYVEAPNSPNPYTSPSLPPPNYNPSNPVRIYADEVVGNYIATQGGLPSPAPSAIPETQERSNLPRIMVRQVTSDNGDAFYREQLAQRAYAEEVRSLLSFMICRNQELIYGPTNKDGTSMCPNQVINGAN